MTVVRVAAHRLQVGRTTVVAALAVQTVPLAVRAAGLATRAAPKVVAVVVLAEADVADK